MLSGDQFLLYSIIWVLLHFFVLIPFFRSFCKSKNTENVVLSLVFIQIIHFKALTDLLNILVSLQMYINFTLALILYIASFIIKKNSSEKHNIRNLDVYVIISSILFFPDNITYVILIPFFILVRGVQEWFNTKAIALSFSSFMWNILMLKLTLFLIHKVNINFFHTTKNVFYSVYFAEVVFISFAVIPFLKEFRSWLRKIINHRYKSIKDIGPYELKDIPFDPLNDIKDPVDAVLGTLPDIGMFKILKVLINEDDGIKILNYNNLKGENQEISIIEKDTDLYDLLTLITNPNTSFYTEQLLAKSDTSYKQWQQLIDDFDYIIPLEDNDNVKMYIICTVSSGISFFDANQEMDHIFQVKRFLELVYKTTAVLQEEVDLKRALEDAREHKDNFESMLLQVDEVNKAYKELQEHQKKLIEAERWISLSRMTVTLNHEINNPLTLVIGMGQLLLAKLENKKNLTEEDFIKSLRSIVKQLKRIVAIVESMRKISVPQVENYMPDIEMIKLDLEGENV